MGQSQAAITGRRLFLMAISLLLRRQSRLPETIRQIDPTRLASNKVQFAAQTHA
jgi:hypothetical protein